MSIRRNTGIAALALTAVLTIAASAPTAGVAAVARHTRLVKSEPAVNDTLATAPRALKLWFSEKVPLAVATIKLLDGAGAAMALAPLARPDTAKDAPIVVGITKPIAAGSYTVNWTVAGDDGHPVKGTFGFVVKASR